MSILKKKGKPKKKTQQTAIHTKSNIEYTEQKTSQGGMFLFFYASSISFPPYRSSSGCMIFSFRKSRQPRSKM
jgi:hypothetical protein